MKILRRIILLLLALPARFVRVPRLTILLYHSVSDEPWQYAVSQQTFKRQMEYLAAHVDTISLSHVLEHMNGKPLAREAVAVTFDDGYRDFLTNALPVLKEFNIPATVFLSLDEADRRELGTERELLRREDATALTHPLFQLGSHALTHRKLTRLTPEELRLELTRSRDLIHERFGVETVYLAYPKGSYSANVAATVRDSGYEAAFTTDPRSVNSRDDLFALPRIEVQWDVPLWEFKVRLTRAIDWYYTVRNIL